VPEPRTSPRSKIVVATVAEARELYLSGTVGSTKVLTQAMEEKRMVNAAKKAGTELPATPAADAITEIHAEGLNKKQAKSTNGRTGSGGGKVNLTDDEVKGVIRELMAEGKLTVGAMVKVLRGTPRGTNAKRLARLFEEVKKEGGANPKKAVARKPAPAKAATKKAAPAKAATTRKAAAPKKATA